MGPIEKYDSLQIMSDAIWSCFVSKVQVSQITVIIHFHYCSKTTIFQDNLPKVTKCQVNPESLLNIYSKHFTQIIFRIKLLRGMDVTFNVKHF